MKGKKLEGELTGEESVRGTWKSWLVLSIAITQKHVSLKKKKILLSKSKLEEKVFCFK